jgi:hypothetical protein
MKRAKKQTKTARPKKGTASGKSGLGSQSGSLRVSGPVIHPCEVGPVEPLEDGGPEPPQQLRFEATIHPGRKARGADWVNYLEIDRIPDRKGEIRALITADECVRLLEQGFEIRLYHAHPVRPLDPALIETDESFRRWLYQELRSIKRPQDKKRLAGSKGN